MGEAAKIATSQRMVVSAKGLTLFEMVIAPDTLSPGMALWLSKFDARSKAILILKCPHDNSMPWQGPVLLLVSNKERLAYVEGHRADDTHACCVDVEDGYFVDGISRRVLFEGD